MRTTKEEIYEALMAAATDEVVRNKGKCEKCITKRTKYRCTKVEGGESCVTDVFSTYITLGRKAVKNRKHYLK